MSQESLQPSCPIVDSWLFCPVSYILRTGLLTAWRKAKSSNTGLPFTPQDRLFALGLNVGSGPTRGRQTLNRALTLLLLLFLLCEWFLLFVFHLPRLTSLIPQKEKDSACLFPLFLPPENLFPFLKRIRSKDVLTSKVRGKKQDPRIDLCGHSIFAAWAFFLLW